MMPVIGEHDVDRSKDYMSVSRMNMLLRCGKQFEYHYVEGLWTPPSGNMVQGTAFHQTIAEILKRKMGGVEGAMVGVEDVYLTMFDELASEEVNWGEDVPGQLKDEGLRLVQLYARDYVPGLKPVSIEERVEVDVIGQKFVLIADIVEEERVIDLKVKGRRFTGADLANDIQATAYNYVYRRPFEFHQALKLKKQQIVVEKVERGERDYGLFREMVWKCGEMVKAGAFSPNPQGWHCSPEYCGFWDRCRG